ncbi:cupin domain-containing protein [Streptomyces sp. NPDC126510]|uniref:JmjC domain-containing protein n=1 Tax=Streptomyces sp. NPDC126510 TaxID=3155317 RepID=UPI0033216FA1
MTDYARLAAPRLAALGRLVPDASSFRSDLPDTPRLHSTEADFRDVLDLDVIDELITSRSLRRPAFRVIRDGKQVDDAELLRERVLYPDTADPRKIAGLLGAGATLVFQGLQELHGPCDDFARRLGHDLGRPIHVNAYLTPAASQGFGDHYDVQDSFIVQVRGTKEWTLHEPVLRRPLSQEVFSRVGSRLGGTVVPEGRTPWATITLSPGDVLWLPRGWVHSARSSENASLHLTISLFEWTAWWALGRALEHATGLPGRFPVSADFVRDPEAAVTDLARARDELVTWLQGADIAELATLVRNDALREFLPPIRRPASTLCAARGAKTAYRVNAHAVLAATRTGERLLLHLADRVVSVPAALADLLSDLLARDRFTVEELPDHPAGAKLLERLAAEGVIEADPTLPE